MGTWVLGAAQAQSVEDLRKQLEVAWKAKDWPAAEAVARQIVAQPQSDIADQRNVARTLSNQGKKAEAFAIRQEVAERPNANSADHNSNCWYQLEQNQPLAVRPACQKAVDQDASNYAALVNLGHTFLLAADANQAMAWYRKTLQHLDREEELQQGPLEDFNRFIKNGWAVAEAQAAKRWFEQTWPQLVALRQVRSKAAAPAVNVHQALDELIDERHQHAQAHALVDQALQDAGANLPDERRWRMLQYLQTNLSADGQPGLALQVAERIHAEQTAKLGADYPDTLTSKSNLSVTYFETKQFAKAASLL